jgi:hypothetical protein
MLDSAEPRNNSRLRCQIPSGSVGNRYLSRLTCRWARFCMGQASH